MPTPYMDGVLPYSRDVLRTHDPGYSTDIFQALIEAMGSAHSQLYLESKDI